MREATISGERRAPDGDRLARPVPARENPRCALTHRTTRLETDCIHGDAIVQLRNAGQDDAERIARLHANSWRQAYRGILPDDFLDGDLVANRLRIWNDRLARDRTDQLVYLAEDGQELVGFVCAFGDENPTWGSYIDNLHVTSGSMERGIGTLLMGHVAEWLLIRYPQSGVYLWVFEANTRARRFYERLGASNAETIADEPDPAAGPVPSCRYTWPGPSDIGRRVAERES